MEGDGVRETLRAFAAHTKHKEHQLEDALGITDLIKKYITVHLGALPITVDQVYPYVADDYEEVAMRTHTPRITAYAVARALDPETFVFVMKNGATPSVEVEGNPSHQEQEALFQQFRDTLFPLPANAEVWEYSARPNRWKERGYFFAAISSYHKGNFRALLRAVHDDGVPKEECDSHEHSRELERIYSVVRGYKIVPECDDATAVAAEIGSMIAEFHFEPALLEDLFGLESETPDLSDPTGEDGGTEMEVYHLSKPEASVRVAADAGPASGQGGGGWSVVDKHFRQLPVVLAYKEAAGLNRIFSTRKTVKQMLLGAAITTTADVGPELEAVLGSRQKTLKVALQATYSPQDWSALIAAVDHLEGVIQEENLTEDTKTQLAALAILLEEAAPSAGKAEQPMRDVLKAALTLHGAKDQGDAVARWNAVWPDAPLEGSALRAYKRYVKKYPSLDEGIVPVVLDL